MALSFYEPLKENEAILHNMLQLAYVGDSVWEVIIRNELLRRGMNVHHMHAACINYVNAHAQACFAEQIKNELTEKELDVIRMGRNSHARHPSPKNQNPMDYSIATGFEALIGFLYITGNEDRLLYLTKIIMGGMEHA